MKKYNRKELWEEIMKGEDIISQTKSSIKNGTYPENKFPHWWLVEMTYEVNRREECCNLLPDVMKNSIRALLDYFNTSALISQQILSDLFGAKFRLFDCIAMWVQEPLMDCDVVKIMAWEFLNSKHDEIVWQSNLVRTDYEADIRWEELKYEV